MKITKAETKAIHFDELDIGDVYEWNDNYYMVIGNDESNDNAVNLETGMTIQFEDDDLVTHVDCELVVR